MKPCRLLLLLWLCRNPAWYCLPGMPAQQRPSVLQQRQWVVGLLALARELHHRQEVCAAAVVREARQLLVQVLVAVLVVWWTAAAVCSLL